MQLNSTKILGISITTSPKGVILEYIIKYLDEPVKKEQKPLIIVTPNPEQIVLAQKNMEFKELLNRADVALPDGIGVSIAAHVSRIPGVEFMEDLVKVAAKQGDTIGLIGGTKGLAVKALDCLRQKHTGLQGWAVEPEALELQEIVQKIRKTNTRIVFVGLGAPKQEEYIARLAHESQKSKVKSHIVFMSVGGSFDIISGRLKRAPVLMRSIGFEWLWRLIQEPWRWRRQLALVKFIWLVLKEKLGV